MTSLVSVVTVVCLATQIVTVFMVKFVTIIALVTYVTIDFMVTETLVTQMTNVLWLKCLFLL